MYWLITKVITMSVLSDHYYVECHELFRNLTSQTDLMLNRVKDYCQNRESISILSVGCGMGLFEIPMLALLMAVGKTIPNFAGIDVNEYACNVFKRKLDAEFNSRLRYEVINQPFQEFSSTTRFDLILYNHVFEYLGDHHMKWIYKSFNLLSEDGNILIFSPNRGGINKIYAEMMKEVSGFTPFFSDDIERILAGNSIEFASEVIIAECDISLLQAADDNPDKIKLLSFLTQIDCRKIPEQRKKKYLEYYLNLRNGNESTIPHPTTFFAL